MSEEFAFILGLCIVIWYVVILPAVNRKYKYINEIFKIYLDDTKKEKD